MQRPEMQAMFCYRSSVQKHDVLNVTKFYKRSQNLSRTTKLHQNAKRGKYDAYLSTIIVSILSSKLAR